MRLGEIKDINYKLKGDSQMKYILIILFTKVSHLPKKSFISH